MAKLILLSVLMLQLPAPGKGPVVIGSGFHNGETYLKSFNEGERIRYTEGFVNGLLMSAMITPAAQDWAHQLHECIQGRTNSQLAEIIKGYIDADPLRWSEQLNVLSFIAIRDSCGPR